MPRNWSYKKLPIILFLSAILAFLSGLIGDNLGRNLYAQFFAPDPKRSVVVLVEENLYQASQQYSGLASEYSGLSNTTIKARIDRYARAIQSGMEQMEAVVLPVPNGTQAKDIQQMLAGLALYESEAIKGRLEGVVLIGDLPLPVVETNNGTITSIYPYTDFVSPRFVWDDATEGFRQNNNLTEPELWHGVIKFTNEDDYAFFFDKNQLARTGHAEFASNQQNLFSANLPEETASFNADLAQAYASYLSTAEERAYNRYTKELLAKLQTAFGQSIEANTDDPSSSQAFARLKAAFDGSGSIAQLTPDILVGPQLQNIVRPVTSLFQGYYSQALPIFEQLGRYYFDAGEIVTPVQQIANIDDFSQRYLLAVNDLLETRLDALATDLQSPIELFKGLDLRGEIVLSDGSRTALNSQLFVNQRIKSAIPSNLLRSTNQALRNSSILPLMQQGWQQLILANPLLAESTEGRFSLGVLHVNSIPANQISTANQCRIYRGSNDGKIIKMTREVVTPQIGGQNQIIGETKKCLLPYDSGAAARWREDELGCDPFYNSELKDVNRTSLATDIFDSQTTHEACYELRTESNYLAAEAKTTDPNLIEDPRLIVLYEAGNLKITLADIILAIDPETDLRDRNRWSAMLANLPNNQITLQQPLGDESNVRAIRLSTIKYGSVKSINSAIYHKDPTDDVLNSQLKDGLATDIPVDNVRYLSFAGKNGQTVKVAYPNVFKIVSFADFQRELRQLEVKLTELSGADQTGTLTGSLTNADQWADGFETLQRINRQTLENAINWNKSDLSRKYQQVLQLELNGSRAFGSTLQANNYEMALLNLEFNNDLLQVDFPLVATQTANPNTGTGANSTGGLNTDTGSSTANNEGGSREPADFAASLKATSNCRQFYNQAGTAVKLFSYFEYLDCWLNNEVQTIVGVAEFAGDGLALGLGQIVTYPVTLLADELNTTIPQSGQSVDKILITPEKEKIAIGSSANQNTLRLVVELQDAENNRLVGKAVRANIELIGPATLPDGTKKMELLTTSGLEALNINLEENANRDITIKVLAEGVSTEKKITFEPAFDILTNNTELTAGAINQQITIRLQKMASNQTFPRQITLLGGEIFGLETTQLVSEQGVITLNPILPTKTGTHPLQILMANGQRETVTITILAGEISTFRLADNESKTTAVVSRMNPNLRLVALDRYGNMRTDNFLAQISVKSGGEIFKPANEQVRANAGILEIPFVADAIGDVTLTLTTAGVSNDFSLLISEQLSKSQLAAWRLTSSYIQLKTNELEPDRELITSWLAKGRVQAIAASSNNNITLAQGINDENNQTLKIAAGNPIGLSHLRNEPIDELIFGDPTFKLKTNNKQSVSNFSPDLGELVLTTADTITNLAGDENTLALATKSGEILEFNQDVTKTLTKLPLGVKALGWWRTEPNSTPKLLAVTEKSCSKNQGCLFQFEFDEDGKLQRKPLNLNYNQQIENFWLTDLSQDGREDLLLVDGNSDLLLFVNENSQEGRRLRTEPIRITNTGLVVDRGLNLTQYFLANYAGSDASDDAKAITLAGRDFLTIADLEGLAGSNITVRDVNGGGLAAGDILEYNLELANRGETGINGLSLALPLGKDYRLDTGSLSCAGCRVEPLANSYYPYLISGLNIGTGTTLSFSFKAEVTKVEVTPPQIQIVVDAGAYPKDGQSDILVAVPNSGLRTYFYSTRNSNGQISYLPYQEQIAGTSIDNSKLSPAAEAALNSLEEAQQPNAAQLAARANDAIEQFQTKDEDNDGLVDALQNTASDIRDVERLVGDKIQNFFCDGGCLALPVNYAFLVNGIGAPGAALPAFGLIGAPPYVLFGQAALFGTYLRNYVSPTITGETAMALCFGLYPGGLCSTFPLVSLDDFGDFCAAINNKIVDLLNAATSSVQTGLDEINEESGLAQAGVKVSIGSASADSQNAAGVSVKTNVKVPGFPEVLTNWFSAQLEEVLNIVDLPDIKIIYPDFTTYIPSFNLEEALKEFETTNATPNALAKAAVAENVEAGEETTADEPVFDRLFNLASTGAESIENGAAFAESKLNKLQDFLGVLADEALIKVETKELPVKYPYLSSTEIINFQRALIQWYNDAKKEVDATLTGWGCYADVLANLGEIDLANPQTIQQNLIDGGLVNGPVQLDGRAAACVNLLLAWGGLSATVNTNIETLADYLDLPYLIFEIDNFEAKYAGAIVDYMDQINTHTVGWLGENTQRLRAWQNMLIELRQFWEDINFFMNISLDYFKKCDDCRSHRFSNLAFLVELFIQIPEPPVIALPRLPNLTLDFSDFQPGATFTIPHFDFQPVPVDLPILPPLDLPDAPITNLAARLPEFGFILGVKLPEAPNFDDLKAILKLPNLPQVTLPKLPLIPLPPDFGDFAASFIADIKVYLDVVSEFLRIVCLLEKGVLPTIPETNLKEQVEAITARPLTPVLPIDIAAGIGFELPNLPTFEYLKELKVIGHLYLNLNVEVLIDQLTEIVNRINNFSTNFAQDWQEQIKAINTQTTNGLLDFSEYGGGKINFGLTIDEEITKEAIQQKTIDLGNTEARLDRLFAQVGQNDQAQNLTPTTRATMSVIDPGLYITDTLTGGAAKLIEYLPTNFADTVMTFIDFDQDRDTDVLYSINNELFLKRNTDNTHKPNLITAAPRVLNWENILEEEIGHNASTITGSGNGANVTLDLPALAANDLLVLAVTGVGLDEQTTEALYVFGPNDLAPALVNDFSVSDQGRWLAYNGNRRNIDFGETEISKATETNLFWQQAPLNTATTVNLTLPAGEETVTWSIWRDGKEKMNKQVLTFSTLVCNDNTPPRFDLKLQNLEATVYQPVEIDATKARDNLSRVVGFYIDNDLGTDSDNDGNPKNDRNLSGDSDLTIDSDFDGNPENDPSTGKFRLRPYDRPGTYQLGVGIIDEAGNETIATVNIIVRLPEVKITQITATSISGHITPQVPNVPIEFIRNRLGQSVIITNGEGESVAVTDENGRFVLDNLVNRDVLLIKNKENVTIGEIGVNTGSIRTLNGSTTRIWTESDTNNSRGTRIAINVNGNEATALYKFNETISDVEIAESNVEIEDLGRATTVIDAANNDNYVWRVLPGNDAGFPGAAVLENNSVRQIIVMPTGKIFINNNAIGVSLERITDATKRQWILVTLGGRTLGKIYVPAKELTIGQVVTGISTNQSGSQTTASSGYTEALPFSDLAPTDPDYDLIRYLYETNVIQGKTVDGNLLAELDSPITRAEFSKVMLKMLCIEPRATAKQLPPVFADIAAQANGTLPWYYAETKEAFLQGFVTGYQGQIDTVTGLPLFLPQNNISVAETTKVILEVMESRNIIDLANLPIGQIWYEPYVALARDLSSRLKIVNDDAAQFLLTNQEANAPDRSISRREFFKIVSRVLTFGNCLDADPDNNGLPQYFEQKFMLKNPGDDPDGDGLTNLREYELKTNPLDPDTDDGGVYDGAEVQRGGDPLNPQDDLASSAGDDGIMVAEIVCNQCPCDYRLEYASTLIDRDTVSAIIKDRLGKIIYRSSETEYQP